MLQLKQLLTFSLIFSFLTSYAQKGGEQLGKEILTDSTSTFFFPIRGDANENSKIGNNKISNILVYDFITEEQRLLFPKDSFYVISSWRYREVSQFLTYIKNWIFMCAVPQQDVWTENCSHTMMFACDRKGNQLRQLTDASENCVDMSIYEKQGFVLLKMQVDKNKNGCINFKDDEFYYKRVNLKDLEVRKNIILPK